MKINLGILIIALFCLQSCAEALKEDSRIVWDEWGVPHIYADTEADVLYAQGWAQMHAHANLILELYGSARGKAAEYWGEEKLQDDILIHTLEIPKIAESWKEKQDPEMKKLLEAFVKGMNDYAEENPNQIKEENEIVLPLSVDDLNQHQLYVVLTRFIGGNELGRAQNWSDMGSNAYAVGPKRSASGKAMLVQNPHLPWYREFTWFESQLIYGEHRLYGANLVGFPGIAIGFNEHMGWTHTNNTLDNCDTYELTLLDEGYLYDGRKKAFEQSSVTLKVKQEDGSFEEQTIPLIRSVFGPVIKKGESKALAIRMMGTEQANTFKQWWEMANSTNLEEFEEALKMGQIPFWNVMYADKHGDIFYIFNGLLPERSLGNYNFWNQIVPGDQSALLWTKAHPYEDLPKLKNPSNNWLQNANDPPWTSTIPQALTPDSFPVYTSPNYMTFRPQRSARMLMEDESITFEELVAYKLSTRLEFADRILDDLFAAVDASDSDLAKEAKSVLMDWDRTADADSKGMLLFFNWANKFGVWNNANYKVKWNPEQPVSTPDGIVDTARAVVLLEEAAQELKAGFGKLDVEWGAYYKLRHNGEELPANGVDGSLGTFRVAWPGQVTQEKAYVGGGDSWVGVIEFGEKINARVLLSYGNASENNHPHNGDQLKLFSEKKLREAWFYDEQLEGHIERKETVRAEE